MPTKIVTQVGCEPGSEDCGNCGLVYLAFGGAPQGCQRYCCACPGGKRCPACLDAEEAYQVLVAAAGPEQTERGPEPAVPKWHDASDCYRWADGRRATAAELLDAGKAYGRWAASRGPVSRVLR